MVSRAVRVRRLAAPCGTHFLQSPRNVWLTVLASQCGTHGLHARSKVLSLVLVSASGTIDTTDPGKQRSRLHRATLTTVSIALVPTFEHTGDAYRLLPVSLTSILMQHVLARGFLSRPPPAFFCRRHLWTAPPLASVVAPLLSPIVQTTPVPPKANTSAAGRGRQQVGVVSPACSFCSS